MSFAIPVLASVAEGEGPGLESGRVVVELTLTEQPFVAVCLRTGIVTLARQPRTVHAPESAGGLNLRGDHGEF